MGGDEESNPSESRREKIACARERRQGTEASCRFKSSDSPMPLSHTMVVKLNGGTSLDILFRSAKCDSLHGCSLTVDPCPLKEALYPLGFWNVIPLRVLWWQWSTLEQVTVTNRSNKKDQFVTVSFMGTRKVNGLPIAGLRRLNSLSLEGCLVFAD